MQISKLQIVLDKIYQSNCRILIYCIGILIEVHYSEFSYPIGSVGPLKTVNIQLYMPAYNHLFSYTPFSPFVNGGAHYCICKYIRYCTEMLVLVLFIYLLY